MEIGNLTIKNVHVIRFDDSITSSLLDYADIYYGSTKIGEYSESFGWPGEGDFIKIDKNFRGEVLKIAYRYFKKYPYGFIVSNPNDKFTILDLYDGNYIKALCNELVKLYFCEENAKYYFNKGYKYFVIYKGVFSSSCGIFTEKSLKIFKRSRNVVFVVEKEKFENAGAENPFNIFI